MGMPIHCITERETIATILEAVRQGRGGCVLPANLEVLRQFRARPELRALFEEAELVVADGMPLVWASRIQGTPLPERVAGSDLITSLSVAAGRDGASVYLVGGNPGAAEAAAEALQASNDAVRIAGVLVPPLGFRSDPEEVARMAEALRAARPSIVYVGLGFPKQEHLIQELRKSLPAAWFMAVGISFSFLGGEVPRAPAWMRNVGLEWLHRLAHEPRRLFGRYLVHGLPFACRLVLHAAATRFGLRKVDG